jgi:hypothetical protein
MQRLDFNERAVDSDLRRRVANIDLEDGRAARLT